MKGNILGSTIKAKPCDGETVNLLSGNVYHVASQYTQRITEEYYTKKDCFAPKDVTISWKYKKEALSYTLKLSTKADMSEAKTYTTYDKYVSISDLYAGKHYYYQIIASIGDKTVESKVFDFVTASLPRTISIEGVSNTRDIGGYYTEDGKYRVRQLV